MNKLKTLIPLGFSCLICVSAPAQKLPTVQQISLRAPKNIKIDGKTDEWHNQFQALNHNIDAYYTIANDDDKLYLTIQAKDQVIAKKMIAGGIVLVINNTKKIDDPEDIIMGSPFLTQSTQNSILGNYSSWRTYSDPKSKDSLLMIINTELTISSKEIALRGIPEIDNSLISVYNDLGIKAVLLFDKTGALNYELAIPLKYLKIQDNSPAKLFYNVTLRGLVDQTRIMPSNSGGVVSVTSVPMAMRMTGSEVSGMSSPTDFWGEYTLAKQ